MNHHTTTPPPAADSGFFCAISKAKWIAEWLDRESLDVEFAPLAEHAWSIWEAQQIAQGDPELLRVKIGAADTMQEPTVRVRLPIASMMTIAKLLRSSLTFMALSFDASDDDVQRAYDLAVWIDILEGTYRMHSETEREKELEVYGGL